MLLLDQIYLYISSFFFFFHKYSEKGEWLMKLGRKTQEREEGRGKECHDEL